MQSIRNIAIIAHVDHGKTTLVDRIIQECKVIDQRKEAVELILDSNDLERERGITIISKNVSVNYKGGYYGATRAPIWERSEDSYRPQEIERSELQRSSTQRRKR